MVNSFKSQWLSPNRRFIDLLQRRVPPSAEVCATSPTMVNEREGQRRINIRQSSAVNSCASSTTMCP